MAALNPRCGRLVAGCLLLVAAGTVSPCPAAHMVARWKLDEAAAPYADSGPNGVALALDAATTSPVLGPGLDGAGAQLNWTSPGPSTRLYASGGALQTDSFGFALWLNPVYINQYDNLLLKEMVYNGTIPAWSRLAWQLHFLADTGSGTAPLELVVRGDNRAQSDYFGSVACSTNLPLHASTAEWIHIAGGYDARTGQVSLYVNGTPATAAGLPGAHNSDGSPLSIGTARNGAGFVAYAATALLEDVQVFDGPLSAVEVAWLRANPGAVFLDIHRVALPGNGDAQVTFNSVSGRNYEVQASTNLSAFLPATAITGTGTAMTVTLSKTVLDGLFGASPRSQLFVRIREVPASAITCQ